MRILLLGQEKHSKGDREVVREKSHCTDLSIMQGRDTRDRCKIRQGVVAGDVCNMCSMQIYMIVGTVERGVGETGLDIRKGFTHLHGKLQGWQRGGHMQIEEEDRLGLCLGNWGLRRGRKNDDLY